MARFRDIHCLFLGCLATFMIVMVQPCTFEDVVKDTPLPWDPDIPGSYLQIRTDSAAGSYEEMWAKLYDENDGWAGSVLVSFSSTMKYSLLGCHFSTEFPITLPTETEKIWKIFYTQTSQQIVIFCNDVKVLDVTLSDAVCTGSVYWRDTWERDVKKIKIDGVSEEYCTVKVDGGVGDWNEWGSCSTYCGPGTRTRYRPCDNPAPANGGSDCAEESLSESQDCVNTEPCPVDGGVGEWSAWSSCSKECGTGTKTRTRPCDNPAPANGGSDCTESLSESQDCNTQSCQDADPAPGNGGSDCTDSSNESQDCNNAAHTGTNTLAIVLILALFSVVCVY